MDTLLIAGPSIIVLLPLVGILMLRRYSTARLICFGYGALAAIVVLLAQLPFTRLPGHFAISNMERTEILPTVGAALLSGMTVAVVQELSRIIVYGLSATSRKLENSMMLSLGFAGLQSFIVAIILASILSSAWNVSDRTLPTMDAPRWLTLIPYQLKLSTAGPALFAVPLIDQAMALVLHMSMSILVLQAYLNRNVKYAFAAILYHALVRAVAASTYTLIENVWFSILVTVVTLLPVASWALRTTLVQRALARNPSASLSTRQLAASFRKELLYFWRTKRFFVLIAVFLVFGMLSPLIAKFTPELLSSIEGAEQFADIIPEPTAVDAAGQYVKNITQFGFLLAILLAMGNVIGEKEKGTAAIVLSKPLPRWTFLYGKFLVQTVAYLFAFILANVGGYYYTVVLFGEVGFLNFSAASLLLFFWLTVFAALTLVGSTISRSTAAAGGISTIFAVIVLLSGSIPRYGELAPGGLVQWAMALAAGIETAPNFGALTTTMVIIFLSLIVALAIFEEQEI